MRHLTGSLLFLSLHVFLCVPHAALAVTTGQADEGKAQPSSWQSSQVKHVYGLPDGKKNEKGSLTVTADGVTFVGKTSRSVLSQSVLLAASAGNQRVELWGMKGRILRMTIPNGGGLAVAGFLHHTVDQLTVEFTDSKGGYHGAVFLLPAKEAERALQSFAQLPATRGKAADESCHGASVGAGSVLVAAPAWDQAEVPAAYRALVYEHLVDRLQHGKGVTHVYREGERLSETGCPQYTVHLAITGFRPGSQVKRSVMGPVGMFVGTTQMAFDATFTDATGRLNSQEKIRTTVRGDSESMQVAEKVAKKIAGQYAQAKKDFEADSAAGKKP